jgi:peptidoglycan/xylan/chitin deacetylase (PgdA/CDA1 family)
MVELERRQGLRSTLYVIPFPNRPGRTPTGGSAPGNRACFYDAAAYAQWFRDLARDGWEFGVHGIDSHLDERAAEEEKLAVERLIGREVVGVRMHWLYHCGESSYRLLRRAGYLYDATLGSNIAVGWPDGRYTPYQASNGLWILPLNIQDIALLGDSWTGPRPAAARRQVRRILEEARAKSAVVTILWHNNNFAPPNCWCEFYQWIIEQARDDGARIMTAREVVEEYQTRAV